MDKILADENYWDQNAFNDLMVRGAIAEPRRKDRLFLCASHQTLMLIALHLVTVSVPTIHVLPALDQRAVHAVKGWSRVEGSAYHWCLECKCSGYGGKYKFGILPVSMFCSGHTYFTQRMPFKLGLDPYVVHATFQFSGTPGKRWRLREALLWNVRHPSLSHHGRSQAMYRPASDQDARCHATGSSTTVHCCPGCRWFAAAAIAQWRFRCLLLLCLHAQDPPEYFDRAGGYLAYKADVPAKMLAAAVPKEEPLTLNGTLDHFQLIHHQLLQMRNAWAIAQVSPLPDTHL